MSFGIVELANAGNLNLAQLDAVSHNLANIGTPGFKAEYLYQRERIVEKPGPAGEKASLFVDHRQGVVQKTDNPLDVALHGEGFFVIETGTGTAYTRKGNFTLNKNNELVTEAGDRVLGEGGPLKINGRQVNIDSDGKIQVDGAEIGSLRIAGFEKRQNLVRRGDGLFTDPGDAGAQKIERPDIKSRSLESANVNAIKEMVDMIGIQRSFESYQKLIQVISEMDKLSTSSLGKLA